MARDGPRRQLSLVMPLLLVFLSVSIPAGAAKPLRYELDVQLDPGRQHIAVTGQVSLQIEEGESVLSFHLHETFLVAECAVNGVPAHCTRARPALPGAVPTSRQVTVELPEAVDRGPLDLEIRYHGVIRNLPGWGDPAAEGPFQDDSAGPDRVELALYSSWYPFFAFGPTFSVEMDVALPRGWVVTCLGREVNRRELQDEATTRWKAQSVNDVLIIASPRFRSMDVETAAGRVQILHTRLPEHYLRREAQETEQTLLLFGKILGDTTGNQLVRHVYSPRNWGQGFSRPGMIVMSEGRVLMALAEDSDASLVHGNAHEAAHFWWRFGSGQGDWINESFAEYFAILAVRAVRGEGPFRDDLEKKRNAVRALPEYAPALAVVPFSNDGHGYTIRYQKGALMLDAFREHMGDAGFFSASRSFYEAIKDRSVGTEEFRAHWKEVLKNDDLLSTWLDSPGGMPVSPDESTSLSNPL